MIDKRIVKLIHEADQLATDVPLAKALQEAINVAKDLQHEYDELAEAYLQLQRTLKRLALNNHPSKLSYSHRTARFYLNHELDNMQLEIIDNKKERKIEIRIKDNDIG